MTPLSEAATELRLVVQRAEDRADRKAPELCHEDLRTETLGDLMDAMDRIDMGLGTRLMLVLYPHTDAQGARR